MRHVDKLQKSISLLPLSKTSERNSELKLVTLEIDTRITHSGPRKKYELNPYGSCQFTLSNRTNKHEFRNFKKVGAIISPFKRREFLVIYLSCHIK
jgi:hypothetical protein